MSSLIACSNSSLLGGKFVNSKSVPLILYFKIFTLSELFKIERLLLYIYAGFKTIFLYEASFASLLWVIDSELLLSTINNGLISF